MNIEEIKEQICDEYCKWPFIVDNEGDLNEICENCPLNKLEDNK